MDSAQGAQEFKGSGDELLSRPDQLSRLPIS